jgi:prepilin-type N-terminal cleavage/methylation domain-containing protein
MACQGGFYTRGGGAAGMSGKRGFTLIELIFTMAILAFIMALALPAYRQYTREWTCRNAAQILYSDLIYQRSRAFSTCLSTGITLNSNGTYQLWELQNTWTPVPAPSGSYADVLRDPPDGIAQLFLALIPAGCDPVTPTSSSSTSVSGKNVNLSANFPMPVTVTPCTITFIPVRSFRSWKWATCYIQINGSTIWIDTDILVACGLETSMITITPMGTIILH